jgi:hypothetical protein
MFPVPLPSDGPPSGYSCSDRPSSAPSTTTAFETEVIQRDTFRGKPRCIVCGLSCTESLQVCHLIMPAEWDVVGQTLIRTPLS